MEQSVDYIGKHVVHMNNVFNILGEDNTVQVINKLLNVQNVKQNVSKMEISGVVIFAVYNHNVRKINVKKVHK